MAYTIRSADPIWAQIRATAFQVTLLTRRQDGFWSIPTIAAEVSDTYATPDSREESVRQKDRFGHASITASVNALEALASVLGAVPQGIAASTLAAIEAHRGKHGGYGTPVPRKDQIEVNAVPRHTAMAALAHLRFSRGGRAGALAQHLEPTIKWLLENRLRQGGWPYDWTDPPHAIGFLSTSSSICALSLYLELGDIPKTIASQVRTAVRSGYANLLRHQRNAVWDGDGAPSIYQVLDSAFALRLLRFANRNGTLSSIIQGEAQTPDQLVALYCANAVDCGWPDNLVSRDASPVTSVSALQLVLETNNPSGFSDLFLASVEKAILSAWTDGGLFGRLTAWDWQCLAMLAAIKAGPIAALEAGTLMERCQNIRRRSIRGAIQPRDLRLFDDRTRRVLTFALTGGEGFKGGALARRIRDLPKAAADAVIQNLIWAILAALAGIVASFLALL